MDIGRSWSLTDMLSIADGQPYLSQFIDSDEAHT